MNDAPIQPARLSPGVLWTLRMLAIGALGVALFLLGIDIAWMIKQRTTEVPFCAAFTWLDCESVLSHPRWSYLFGIPVAAPAAGLYGVLIVMLFRTRRREAWGVFCFAAGAIPPAAAWFIWLQLGVMHKVCQYCMVEHAIGLTLAALLTLHGYRLGRLKGGAIMLGVAAAGLMIAGQLIVQPAGSRHIVVATEVGDEGPYREPGPEDRAVRLAEGRFILNTTQHPMIGSPTAQRVIVEVIDYSCPRCRLAQDKLKQVMPLLGPDYALMVMTFPLNTECNHHIEYDDERHKDACFYSKLALALWLVDASQYEAFHHFLFANQQAMTRDQALAEAHRLVGRARLEGMRIDPRIDKLLKRDIDLAARLGVQQLPGVLIGNQVMTYLGPEPTDLAEKFRKAFEP